MTLINKLENDGLIDKQSWIERSLCAAAKMDASHARKVLMLICEAGMTTDNHVTQPTEGQKHYAKREASIKRMHSGVGRILKYAKHETLRKIEKHFRANPPIQGAEGDVPEPSSLRARLTFSKPDFTTELLAALREDSLIALTVAGQQLFDEIGKDDPWTMPGEFANGFLNYRANLLKDVPDEVHKEIMSEIQEGLANGDTRKELMARISTKFDEIYKGRFETVANTETAAAFNFARDKAMKEAGVTHKKWLLSHSPLIKEHRITHEENDGQIKPIDEPFDIGGVQFMYPGDDMLGAGPEDIINCHCVSIPVEAPIESAGEKEGHPFRGNQYTTGIESPQEIPEEQKRRMELYRERYKQRAEAMAKRMDFDTKKIFYNDGPSRKFTVGEKQFEQAGCFLPDTGRIVLDRNHVIPDESIDAITAHEISHAQFDVVKKAQEAEHERISKLIKDDTEFHKHFTAGGFPRPESKAYLRQQFPVSHALSRTWGDSYLSSSEGDKTQQMIKDDGVSNYSTAYWQKGAVDKNMGLSRAVDETLAEIGSWMHTGAKHISRPSRDWEQFARDIRIQYKRIKHPYQEIKDL